MEPSHRAERMPLHLPGLRSPDLPKHDCAGWGMRKLNRADTLSLRLDSQRSIPLNSCMSRGHSVVTSHVSRGGGESWTGDTVSFRPVSSVRHFAGFRQRSMCVGGSRGNGGWAISRLAGFRLSIRKIDVLSKTCIITWLGGRSSRGVRDLRVSSGRGATGASRERGRLHVRPSSSEREPTQRNRVLRVECA